MLSEDETLLRLLEISALLLPVVGIFLQVAFRIYESSESNISDQRKRNTILVGMGAILALLIAAINTVFALVVDVRLFNTSGTLAMVVIGLVLVAISAITVAVDATDVYGGMSNTINKPSIPSFGSINAVRIKLADIIDPTEEESKSKGTSDDE